MAFIQGYWADASNKMGLAFGTGGTTSSNGTTSLTLYGSGNATLSGDLTVGTGGTLSGNQFTNGGLVKFTINNAAPITGANTDYGLLGTSGGYVSGASTYTGFLFNFHDVPQGKLVISRSAGMNDATAVLDVRKSDRTTSAFYVTPSGIVYASNNIGIATTTPSYPLDVVGTAQFSQPVLVGTPTANSHAVNKGYLDSALSGISTSSQWSPTSTGIYYSSGKVGIGTATPGAQLHIVTTGVADNLKLDTSGAAGVAGLSLATQGSVKGYWALAAHTGDYILDAVAGDMAFRVESPGKILFGQGGTYSTMAVAGKRIGIGTASPSATLHISSSTGSSNEWITGAASGSAQMMLGQDGSSGNYTEIIRYGNSVSSYPGKFIIANQGHDILFSTTGYNPEFYIKNGGYVGLSTTTPSFTLDVVGTGQFSQPVLVGTPVANGHAATKSYVDGLFTNPTFLGTALFDGITVSGTSTLNGNISTNGAFVSNINMNGNNITGVNKLTVSTIDPVYTIGEQKYATYVSDSIGIKVVASGKGSASLSNAYVIDFKNATKGSDEWLFWQTIREGNNMADVTVLLTPEGTNAALWYELKPTVGQVLIHSSKTTKFSYQLSAPRHDANEWGNTTNTNEKGITLPLR
jgi:hypothetical protein